MCNLYRLTSPVEFVARLFRAEVAPGLNAGGEVYPGCPGLVVPIGGIRQMTWGFPLSLKSKKTGQPLRPKPVNNARTDNLGSFMWRASFEHRRCLIPVESFAEAEGPNGRMTRTWFSLPDQPIMAMAGIWCDSDEWGPVYSMVMTDASDAMQGVHDRMPVILRPDQHAEWLIGNPESAMSMCKPYQGDLVIDRTEQPRSGR